MVIFTPYFHEQNLLRQYRESLSDHAPFLGTIVTGEQEYSDSLGWLEVDKWAEKEQVADYVRLAAEVRKEADVFVLIGVGGSNNAARSVITALQDSGPEILYAGNTLSATSLVQLLEQLEGKSVYVNCIAKNFETLEPGLAFRVLRQYLIKRYGADEAATRMIVTGSKGSHLEKLCQAQGYRFLEFPRDIGGRYTALTSVGLFPMAVAGIDIVALVAGANQMAHYLADCPVEKNPACQYATYRYVHYQAGYHVEQLVSFEPQFQVFYRWWIQLFGESEGKNGKGLLPTAASYSEDLHAIGQFVQEGSPILFETFLTVKSPCHHYIISPDELEDGFDYLDGLDLAWVNHAAFEATRLAHSSSVPTCILEIDTLDAYHFGQLFYFFQLSCYLSGRLLGVHPFDQPGVEAYKELMFAALKK